MGKRLIFPGLGIAFLGLWFPAGEKFHLPGKIPGDIVIRRNNMVFYFPFATCLILSLMLTIFLRFFRKN